MILIAPIYLTYRTYELFSGRLDDEKRHTGEIQRLHEETVAALAQARTAEQALAAEKERLALALTAMTRLEQTRNQLLGAGAGRARECRGGEPVEGPVPRRRVARAPDTPLNAILGWSEMLAKHGLNEGLRDRAVLSIGHSARRQAQLIEDLLDVARITSGKLRLERTFVDVHETVRDAIEVVLPTAQAKRLQVEIDLERSCGEVFGDGARLQQVAVNLLSNAVKFTKDGGTVRVSLRGAGDWVELMVSDTGKGIAPEFLPWVFEAFRQGDASTTRAHGGLGLGLSIVKTLVDAHNGRVSARSDGAGRGATFTVLLPATGATDRRRPRTRRPPRLTAPAIRPDPSLEGLSVLLVDDDDQSREVVAAHLQSSGCVVAHGVLGGRGNGAAAAQARGCPARRHRNAGRRRVPADSPGARARVARRRLDPRRGPDRLRPGRGSARGPRRRLSAAPRQARRCGDTGVCRRQARPHEGRLTSEARARRRGGPRPKLRASERRPSQRRSRTSDSL